MSYRTIKNTVLIIVLVGACSIHGAGATELQRTMRALQAALTEVLVATRDGPGASAAARQRLDQAIDVLTRTSGALQEHSGSEDGALIAYGLEQASVKLRVAAARDDAQALRELSGRALDTCHACHRRKQQLHPRPTQADKDRVSIRDQADSALPEQPLFEVRVLIATREYARADALLSLWFQVLRATPQRKLAAEEAETALRLISELLIDHLNAPGRLAQMLRAPALPPSFRTHGLPSAWTATLNAYLESKMPTARTPAQNLTVTSTLINSDPGYAFDEHDRVAHLLAGRHARDALESPQATASQAAHANYLLGLIEHRLAGGGWLPLRELYLEQAITLDPHSDAAARAFALLDAHIESAFDGAGRDPEVERHLDRLEILASPRAQ